MLTRCRFARSFTYPVLQHRLFCKDRANRLVKPGKAIVLDNVPHKVTRIIQGKRGKGGGFVKATLKNLESGSIFEKTFTTDDIVEGTDLEREQAQYTWCDGENYNFMSSVSFEEVQVPQHEVDCKHFLKDGEEVILLKFRDRIIGVELLNIIVEYTVISVDSTKEQSGYIPAILDSGASVMVPMFIKEGTKIKVNTQVPEYVGRV